MLSLSRQNSYRDRLRLLWPGWQPATEIYEATIRRYLRPATRLLDLGCGRGGVVEQIGDCDGRLVGVDPDITSLAEHRLAVAAFPRSAAFLEQLPFRSASFDLLVSSWVFEHLPAPPAAFAEMARVLRPGGHLIVLAPNGWHPVSVVNRLMASTGSLQARLVPRLYGRAEDDAFRVCYRANSVRRLRQLGEAAGFEPLVIRTISDPTYLAFNTTLFALSRLLERLLPPASGVHLVADFVRP